MSDKLAYGTTFHPDKTVTIWNVYRQQWERTARPADDVLASLGTEERSRVIRHCDISDEMAYGPKTLIGLKSIYGVDEDIDTIVIDALTDLRHLCDLHEIDFANCDRIAHDHYREELTDRDQLAKWRVEQ